MMEEQKLDSKFLFPSSSYIPHASQKLRHPYPNRFASENLILNEEFKMSLLIPQVIEMEVPQLH
jgi:hypothetical protein